MPCDEGYAAQKKKGFSCKGCSEEFNRSYYEQILSEYNLLTHKERERNPSAVKVITDIQAKVDDAGCPTCDDVYSMEKALIQLQSVEKIRLERNAFRDKYREMCTPERYTNYLCEATELEKASAGMGDDKAREVLLSDVNFLLSEIHLKYTLMPYKEMERKPIIEWIGFYILVSILLVLLFARFADPGVVVMMSVMAVGSLGALVSLIRRLNEVPAFNDPVVGFLSLKYGRYSVYASPVSGAISALILYFIFLGGLVEGTLFPNLTCAGPFYTESPVPDCVDYGKLFVWSFIAGFAERFVPDILDRLTAQKKGEPPAAPPAPQSALLRQQGEAKAAAAPAALRPDTPLAPPAAPAPMQAAPPTPPGAPAPPQAAPPIPPQEPEEGT